MQRILIIEASTTLSRVLESQIAPHYPIETIRSHRAGLARLAESGEAFSAVVMGWPEASDPVIEECLAHVSAQSVWQHLPLLVLSHSVDTPRLDWVAGRSHSALLHWDDFREVGALLDGLLDASRSLASTVAGHDERIRVLFVDDSRTARMKIRRLLEAEGYEVETSVDADEALMRARHPRTRVLPAAQAEAGVAGEETVERAGFDIAIIDYFMPGVTGDKLCRRLRADPRTSGITTAVFTSTYRDQIIADSLAAGAVECMFKNESDALFLARVAAMSRTVRSTRRIEHERSRLQGILSSVGDGVYGVDRNGLLTFMNPAALRILGYAPKQGVDFIGRPPSAVFHPDAPSVAGSGCSPGVPRQTVETALAQESVFTRRDGTAVLVELTLYPLSIGGRVEGAVIAFRDICVRKRLEDELKWQASHDPLTRLFNRKYLEDALEQEVRRLRRGTEAGALLYLDLDRFKYVNDTAGHAAGDRLLIEIARHLTGRLRETDLLARIGGDEFALILRGVGREDIFRVADEFRALLTGYTFSHEGRNYKINGSIGVALLDRHIDSTAQALANADIACHIAKGQGRNQTHVFQADCDERVAMDLELGWSTRLHTALEEGLFELHFQPIIPLASIAREDMVQPGLVDGRWYRWAHAHPAQPPVYEVLMRLPDARGELVSPNAFIPTAERFNLMPAIDRWVVARALEKLTALHRQGRRVVFSINLSSQSLADAELAGVLRNALAEPGLDASSVVLEITEEASSRCLDAAQHFIEEFRALGCRFAMDNFGSGYCSFTHLKHLAVDFIKIDALLTQSIVHDATDRAIIQSITDIAHSLGKLVVAEAVESPDILQALVGSGVDFVQGHHLCPPIAALPGPCEGGEIAEAQVHYRQRQ